MPAMHMLRLVLMMLANPKTFSRGLFMLRRSLGKAAGGAASGVGAAPPPDSRTWRKSFEVVFVDSTGWLNLAASMSKAALVQARSAAAHSIQMLNLGTPEAFDAVFATRQRLVSGVEGLGRAQQSGQGWTMSAPDHLCLQQSAELCTHDPSALPREAHMCKACFASLQPCRRTLPAALSGLPAELQLLSQRHQLLPAAAQAATCDYWFHIRPPPAVPRVDQAGRLLPLRGFSSGNRELLQDVPAWR